MSVKYLYGSIRTTGDLKEVHWYIPNFKLLRDLFIYESPPFTTHDNEHMDTSWVLQMKLSDTSEDCVKVCLNNVDYGGRAEVSFGVLKSDNVLETITSTYTMNYSFFNLLPRYILDVEGQGYLCDGQLIITCNFILPYGTKVRKRKTHPRHMHLAGEPSTSGTSTITPLKQLSRDFRELLLKKEDCDVTLTVKDQEFQAHKIILKARSPVFASTFRSDMKEKKTGVVDIVDCDPSSFSDFLNFLYCADVDNVTKENVFNLFTIADKYDVQGLRTMCLEFMKKNLSVDIFCDTLALALLHSEADLIKLATDFFTKNAPKIVVTNKWQLFAAENPTHSNELLIKLLVPNKNKKRKQ